MQSIALLLCGLLLAACVTVPQYDTTWTWDSPVFDEVAALGQAGLLSSQKDTFYTSIWTMGGGALQRRQEYHLREQHELWVRRQVEVNKMTVEEARTRVRAYVPSSEH